MREREKRGQRVEGISSYAFLRFRKTVSRSHPHLSWDWINDDCTLSFIKGIVSEK